jgi:hypothetical protein
MNASVDPALKDLYLKTVIRFESSDRTRWELKANSDVLYEGPSLFSLMSQPSGRAFVITAFNPFSEEVGAERNAFNQSKLKRLLEEKGFKITDCEGCDPVSTYKEPSFMVFVGQLDVDVAREEVREIALAYGQNAIFEINATEISLLGAVWENVLESRTYSIEAFS